MKIDEEARAKGLEFLTRWAHDSGADSVIFLEDRVSAVVKFPSGLRMLVTGEPCPCRKPGCSGWIVRNHGGFREKVDGLDSP